MAHFARVIDNIVEEVIVVSNEDCGNLEFPQSEPIGQNFIASLNIKGQWLQTSYSGSFRGTYAGIGWTYDETIGQYGEFIAPTYEPLIP